ncbi:hypothetical protein [Acidithiobacillus albertensis]|uniref:hypothetical protein n=1 Tax=Acidithiobacillus albertensis TaxID=119978 RepID=UPI001471DBB7|nr:hypothetical protein [Acidithiobacillus albertensis]
MGEAEKHPQKAIPAAVQTMIVDTLGGRIQVSWDQESAATPMGQMVFFAAYLETTGLFDTWVEESPLHYTSPNAPQKRDVLGTLFLSILAGHRRYAHVTALRSDGVSPNILGMGKIVSEDALRRALSKIPEAEGTEWMRKHLFKSVVAACQTPWILDIDTTVKPLFGHQEGAEVGYNPHKARTSLPCLSRLLDRQPALAAGCRSYGGEYHRVQSCPARLESRPGCPVC